MSELERCALRVCVVLVELEAMLSASAVCGVIAMRRWCLVVFGMLVVQSVKACRVWGVALTARFNNRA